MCWALHGPGEVVMHWRTVIYKRVICIITAVMIILVVSLIGSDDNWFFCLMNGDEVKI